MQIYLYNSDDFDSLGAAIKERRIISAMAVFFEVWYHQAWRLRQMSFKKGVVGRGGCTFYHQILIKTWVFLLKTLSHALIDSSYRA